MKTLLKLFVGLAISMSFMGCPPTTSDPDEDNEEVQTNETKIGSTTLTIYSFEVLSHGEDLDDLYRFVINVTCTVETSTKSLELSSSSDNATFITVSLLTKSSEFSTGTFSSYFADAADEHIEGGVVYFGEDFEDEGIDITQFYYFNDVSVTISKSGSDYKVSLTGKIISYMDLISQDYTNLQDVALLYEGEITVTDAQEWN